MDHVGARHRVAHRQALEQVGERLAERVSGALSDRDRQRREPLRPIGEDQVVRSAGRVCEDLSQRRIRVRTVGLELADAVLEREASFLDAAQHHRRREHLCQAVELEWGVALGGDGPRNVLLAECALPDDVVLRNDRGGHTRDARLNAQRVEVVPEQAQHQVVCAHGRAGEQHDGDGQDQKGTAHRWRPPP